MVRGEFKRLWIEVVTDATEADYEEGVCHQGYLLFNCFSLPGNLANFVMYLTGIANDQENRLPDVGSDHPRVCDIRGYPTMSFLMEVQSHAVSVTLRRPERMRPVYLIHHSQRIIKRSACGHTICTLSEYCTYLDVARALSFHALDDLNCPSTRLPAAAEHPSKTSGRFWVTAQPQTNKFKQQFPCSAPVTW